MIVNNHTKHKKNETHIHVQLGGALWKKYMEVVLEQI